MGIHLNSLRPAMSILATWRPRGLSKWVISRVISTVNGVTLIITLLITELLSPLGLQVEPLLYPKSWPPGVGGNEGRKHDKLQHAE